MRRSFSALLGVVVWFAVIAQFFLMMHNLQRSVSEAVIRFFSYFTILTNILTAIYFTLILLGKKFKPGVLTAITIYITIVGLVYQVALRHVWQPTGLQRVVDELLHTINPVLVIIFWYLFEQKKAVKYSQVTIWTIYPLAYLVYILIRGSFSHFYPYPFVNDSEIGMSQTMINALIILLLFIAVSCLFVFIGKKIDRSPTL